MMNRSFLVVAFLFILGTVAWAQRATAWGEKSGKKGYLSMTDAWFDKYVQVIVVHKKYIPEKTVALFDTRAELLPPWDPMFKMLMMED